jgi:outer membrane protein assembly factor BamE (lipoprotein component of BamABCDE complex)
MTHSARPFSVLATLWVVVLMIAGGCVSSGHKIQSDLVKRIRVGITTKSDVIALFGEPPERPVAGRTETWVYAYAKNSGFGSSSQNLDLRFENDVVVICRFDAFQLDHLGRPVSSTSIPCDQL